MFGRRIPFTQMALVALLGVGGGIYIYKPYFEPVKTPGQQNQDVPKKQSETDNSSQ
ncbi:protein PIGBOS1 [Chelmon rostratus]|uniref:protein PIGBOS1 n=1 Tax=Chelmon rostratus TaxID=109905 RepID=UPI001BE5A8CA|nr:protein PIGBOS1 [Chelmon rostratus]